MEVKESKGLLALMERLLTSILLMLTPLTDIRGSLSAIQLGNFISASMSTSLKPTRKTRTTMRGRRLRENRAIKAIKETPAHRGLKDLLVQLARKDLRATLHISILNTLR